MIWHFLCPNSFKILCFKYVSLVTRITLLNTTNAINCLETAESLCLRQQTYSDVKGEISRAYQRND
jgi:hypothetical protein